MRYLKYLWYVIRHKWFVFVECVKLGVPLRGIVHDWNKLLPDEFFPYAEFFYGEGDQAAFDLAWLKHQRRNNHHWQAWVLREDSGKVKVLPMPDRVRREMLADWRGAGRAIHGPSADTAEWYMKTCDGRQLHPDTQAWVEAQLGFVSTPFIGIDVGADDSSQVVILRRYPHPTHGTQIYQIMRDPTNPVGEET